MREEDRARFFSAFERLCLVHEKRLGPEELEKLAGAYWAACSRMHVDLWEAAVARAIETGERFPRPAALWAIAKEARNVRRYDAKPEGPWLAPARRRANQILFAWAWKRACRGPGIAMPAPVWAKLYAAAAEVAEHFTALLADKDPEATDERLVQILEARCERIASAA